MFNKNSFAEYLKKAIGERTTTTYADITGVNRTYISKLLNEKLDNPPSPDIIKRLSRVAYGGVTYEDFMTAAGYLPDMVKEAPVAYAEVMNLSDEVEQEIQIAKESGVKIDFETAKRMVENRKRLMQKNKKPNHEEYVLAAKTLADAGLRIADLFNDYQIDEAEYLMLNKLAYRKYGLPLAPSSEEAAHLELNIPGTGVFEGDGNNENKPRPTKKPSRRLRYKGRLQ